MTEFEITATGETFKKSQLTNKVSGDGRKVKRNASGFFLLFMLLSVFAQASFVPREKEPKTPFPWKQFAIASGLQFTAGWLDNEADVTKFNYHLFLKRWPNTNQQWTNPKLSAVNKYKDWPVDKSAAYPGSKTWLAWTTDKYHLNRFLRNFLLTGSIATYLTIGAKLDWKQIAKIALGSWLSFALGSGASSLFYGMGRE